jgi:hypothetical protein
VSDIHQQCFHAGIRFAQGHLSGALPLLLSQGRQDHPLDLGIWRSAEKMGDNKFNSDGERGWFQLGALCGELEHLRGTELLRPRLEEYFLFRVEGGSVLTVFHCNMLALGIRNMVLHPERFRLIVALLDSYSGVHDL